MTTDNYTDIEHNDFEEMRRQMAELKTSLEQRELVSERLMRQVMASKGGYIRRFRNLQLFFSLPFVLLCFLIVREQLNLTWYFWSFTALMMVGAVGATYYTNRLSERDYGSMPLLELMKSLEMRRRHRRMQEYVGVPVGVLWVVWYCIELSGTEDGSALILPSVIGGVIGAIIGVNAMLRMQRIDKDAIDDIKEILKD